MADTVEKLRSITEVDDRVDLIEQMTISLRDAHFDQSKDPIDRRISEMINLVEV